jgi:hypothetical protein
MRLYSIVILASLLCNAHIASAATQLTITIQHAAKVGMLAAKTATIAGSIDSGPATDSAYATVSHGEFNRQLGIDQGHTNCL